MRIEPLALYFGVWSLQRKDLHQLHGIDGRVFRNPRRAFPDLPWPPDTIHATSPPGKRPGGGTGVQWVVGNTPDGVWHAFFWHEDCFGEDIPLFRSAFYTCGFATDAFYQAFRFACKSFPKIMERRTSPLVLEDRGGAPVVPSPVIPSLPPLTRMKSSNIDSIGHDGSALYVKFHGGSTYRYRTVDRKLFDELMKAESVGRFFHQHIKPTHLGDKLP